MNKAPASYIPALRFRWLTRFYDSILRATLKEEKFKELLVRQVRIEPGHRVLDLGCGTATLSIMLKQACPEAIIVGLDGDPQILAIAREKVAAANVEVELHHGMAFAPPFQLRSFDRVVCSLVFHHLTAGNKRRTLEAVRGLLKSAGELHVADWGQAQNVLMRVAFFGVQLLDGFDTTADSVSGRLVQFITDAGFTDVAETHHEATMLGTLSLYQAVNPARPSCRSTQAASAV